MAAKLHVLQLVPRAGGFNPGTYPDPKNPCNAGGGQAAGEAAGDQGGRPDTPKNPKKALKALERRVWQASCSCSSRSHRQP